MPITAVFVLILILIVAVVAIIIGWNEEKKSETEADTIADEFEIIEEEV